MAAAQALLGDMSDSDEDGSDVDDVRGYDYDKIFIFYFWTNSWIMELC